MSHATHALLAAERRPAVGPTTPATACFVDLARFTTISEALGQTGSRGTERLVELINRFFTPAIERAAELGGDVVGFAGDALTVVFPGGPGPAQRWASFVMGVVDELEPVEAGDERFVVDAKIGIGDGEQACHLVGTGSCRRAVTSGSAIDRAVRAEAAVSPGRIGVLLDRPPPEGATPSPDDPAVFVVGPEARGNGDPGPARGSLRPSVPREALAAFVPPRVVARLATAKPELLDEHRPVTVIFADFGAESLHGNPATVDRLATALTTVERRGGTPISIGSGDKGTTLLAAFGAPVAIPGQRSAAIFTAEELVADGAVRAGIASGLCFAGRVGATQRWSYTLIGDVPNTAARLMAIAPRGRVMVDEATSHAADPTLRFAGAGEQHLKGKQETIRAAVLEEIDASLASDDAADDLPLVGREVERALADRLRQDVAQSGSGRALVIVGESGVGKTRLARDVADRARQAGFRVVDLGLQHRVTGRSLGPWRSALLQVLDLAPQAGPSEFEAAAAEHLGEESTVPQLLRTALFGSASQGEAVQGLDARETAEIVEHALVDLLVRGRDEPLLIVIDDAHDLDEASRRLAERVLRRLDSAPLLVVAMAQPGTPPTAWRWTARIELGELTAEAALELVEEHQRKASLDLDAGGLRRIVDRVGGNAQLLRLLADHVGVDRGPATEDVDDVEAGADLPNDARSIVLARYDRLPMAAREALAMASILGRHFSRADFVGAFGRQAPAAETLEELIRLRLIERSGPDTVSFASPLMAQVAYEANAHAVRTVYHREVGLHIERLPTASGTQRVEDLAHHFGFTDDRDRHRRYFGPAGRRAKEAFANERAIHWLRRAVSVAEAGDDGGDREVASLRLDLASTLEHIGRWDEAIDGYRHAAEDPAVGPRALASLAFLQTTTDDYALATTTLEESFEAADRLDDPATTEWVLNKASIAHTHAGRFDQAAEAAERQLAVARTLDDPARVAAALSNSGAAKSWSGRSAEARAELGDALDLLTETGALAMASEVGMDLAMVALDEGELDECLRRLGRSVELARTVGYRRVEAAAMSNTALALVGAERAPEAWEPAVVACRLLLEIGDLSAVASTFGLFGLLLLDDGRPREAIDLLARTIQIELRTGSILVRERALGVLAEAWEALDDDERAAACQALIERSDDDASEEELAVVAPWRPVDEVAVEGELGALLELADPMIEQLG